MSFAQLTDGLTNSIKRGFVYEKIGPDGLRLYCYTNKVVYDRAWDEFSLMSRGLILDYDRECVAATPFTKFFNVGERAEPIPNLPFDTYEKVDGSLIIIFHHLGEWKTATKGSFDSDQAKWAAEQLSSLDTSVLHPGDTYLAEAVYPENRIVVHYAESNLYLLSAYGSLGHEYTRWNLRETAFGLGCKIAASWPFSSVAELIVRAETLPATQEGYVIRFSNGHRLKVKGAEYKRIHSFISNCTPLAVWESMRAGMDLNDIRRDIPEEFWGDFDSIRDLLQLQIDLIYKETSEAALLFQGKTDKEVGLMLPTLSEDARKFIFPFRNEGGDLMKGRARAGLFRAIRPDSNQLPGYSPSYAMKRVVDA